MLYTYPDYYNKFSCVADKCEDTCCAGWQILIDDESIEKYKKEHENDERIDWENEVFHHQDGKRCAFLNEKNLCDMYTQWGKDSLCITCDRYPRHIEEFENIREYTLSLSCPEVAKLILGLKDKVTFVEKEDELEEVDEDFDGLMYSLLVEIRELLYKILQDRTVSIEYRVAMILNLSRKCQDCIEEWDVFAINEIINDFGVNFEKYVDEIEKDFCWDYYETTFPRFKRLYDLEVLNDLWADMTDEAAEMIFSDGSIKCNELHNDFITWFDENNPDNSIMWEQILIYFVSTYFCGAVYDGNVIGKVETAVTSLVCIYDMLMARWIKNDYSLSFDDIVFVTYMYSRELEHSDINLDEMENID